MRFGAAPTMFAALVVLAPGCTTRDSDEFRHPVQIEVFEVKAGEEMVPAPPLRLVTEYDAGQKTTFSYVVSDAELFRVTGSSQSTLCSNIHCANITSVAVHNGTVYLGAENNPNGGNSCPEGATGKVLRIAKNADCFILKDDSDAPKPDVIFEGDVRNLDISVDNTLRWTGTRAVHSITEPDTCTTSPLCPNRITELGQPAILEAITVDDNKNAYVTSAQKSAAGCDRLPIWKVETDGTKVVTGLGDLKACAIDIVYAPTNEQGGVDAALFWVDVGTLEVFRASLADETQSVVGSGLTSPIAIAADGDHVYWRDRGKLGESDGALWRYDRRSAEVDVLADGLDEPTDIALERDRIYWIERGGSNRLMTLSK